MRGRIRATRGRFIWPVILTGAWAVAVVGVATQAPARAAVQLEARPQQPAAERRLDFNWDVRPILSDYCFRCHGPDGGNRRANLRLDTAEGAYAALSRPNAFAIVPGKPDESEVIRRITHANTALRMPPAATNKTLQPEQIEIIRKWIDQGAEYKPHWAFIPPTKPAVPQIAGASNRTLTDIDRFVMARLQREALALSSPADRETLINRVTLTLTGLPPALDEVDAFVKDRGADAYERLVDRLLASPAYGEHMGNYWLDIARYAESDGFLDDLHDRLFWPYRDWVISAFNKNMPFDQFSTWQLAGDLLPSHTKEQLLATAFLRVGKRTTENGAIDEEYRVEYAVDRANTVGVGFLGLTVGCARCHDHKYDPIPTKDFYSLTGFFNSTDEPGFYAPGRSGVTAGPTLRWADAPTEARIAELHKTVAARRTEFDRVRATAIRDLRDRAAQVLSRSDELTRTLQQATSTDLVAHYPFEETMPVPDDKLPRSREQTRPSPPLLDPETRATFGGGGPAPVGQPVAGGGPGSGTAAAPQGGRGGRRTLPSSLVREDLLWSPSVAGPGSPAYLQNAVLKEGIKGKAFHIDDTNRGLLGQDVGQFDRTQPFSVDLWINPNAIFDDVSVFNHEENANSGGAGYVLHLEKNHLRFSLMHSRAGNMIRVVSKTPVPVNQWTQVTITYDGSSQAAGVKLYVNGQRADVDVLRDNLTRSTFADGGGNLGDEFLGFSFGTRFRMLPMKGAIDEIRIYKKTLTPFEVRYLHASVRPNASVGSPTAEEVAEVLAASDPRVTSALATLTAARDAENQVVSSQPQIMVMGDTPTPRPTYVLVRGDYTSRGEQVPVRALDQVFRWDASLAPNRMGLTRWLFDAKNPLTSRVFVNRMWQMHFGRGIVETSEDFGAQGSIPVNPELLDYLAVTFVESGWDVKRLHKAIVMSETFKQQSVITPDHLSKDPRNLLLARYPRVRMPAELVRDSALAVSRLLKRTVGGPSVYPYQPPTIWDGFSFYRYPDEDKVPVDANHRRSMYSFIKRNAPHPAMAAFDMTDRGLTTVRRNTSNTPLQALVQLDDPQYLEAYRQLATNVLKVESTPEAQVRRLFRVATRRQPAAAEMTEMTRYFQAQQERYTRDREAAAQLIGVGRTRPDPSIDPVQLAALMNVTTVVMNTPDAYSLR